MLQTLKMMRELLYLLLLLLQLLLKLLIVFMLFLLLLLLLLQLFLKLQNELLLLLLLLQLPLIASHHLNDRVFTSRASFVGGSAQQPVLGVIGQRALHKHDALESGLDAGDLQHLHALPHNEARFVNQQKEENNGDDVADDDARLRKIRVAVELGGIEGRRHALARYSARF